MTLSDEQVRAVAQEMVDGQSITNLDVYEDDFAYGVIDLDEALIKARRERNAWAHDLTREQAEHTAAVTRAEAAEAELKRVRKLLSRWEQTPGSYAQHGSALGPAWQRAADELRAELEKSP